MKPPLTHFPRLDPDQRSWRATLCSTMRTPTLRVSTALEAITCARCLQHTATWHAAHDTERAACGRRLPGWQRLLAHLERPVTCPGCRQQMGWDAPAGYLSPSQAALRLAAHFGWSVEQAKRVLDNIRYSRCYQPYLLQEPSYVVAEATWSAFVALLASQRQGRRGQRPPGWAAWAASLRALDKEQRHYGTPHASVALCGYKAGGFARSLEAWAVTCPACLAQEGGLAAYQQALAAHEEAAHLAYTTAQHAREERI